MSSNLKTDGLVSVIIRCHNPSRLGDLDECLFSLAGQDYDYVEAIIVTQNFSDEDLVALAKIVKRYSWQISAIKALNVIVEDGADGRSELVNTGIAARSGRYLAFLDFDDTVYGNIYTLLTNQLKKSDAAICFGATNRIEYFSSGGVRHKSSIMKLFVGLPKLAVFIQNQHPIHSYLVDTYRVEEGELYFDHGESRNEDYAFLIRLLSKYKSDDSCYSVPVCDYYINMDGGNTVMGYGTTAYDLELWHHAHLYVERVRESLSITTSYADLKHFMEWSARKDQAALIDTAQNLERRLAVAEQERNDVLRQLVSVVETAKVVGKVTHFAIDEVEKSDTGRRVTGWCSGGDGAVPTASIVTKYGKRCPEIVVEKVSRPDVSYHLSKVFKRPNEGSDVYGFSVMLPSSEAYLLKFTTIDGGAYALELVEG